MRRWGDVVVPRWQGEVIDLGDVESFGNLLFVGASVVSATHGAALPEDFVAACPEADEIDNKQDHARLCYQFHVYPLFRCNVTP